MQYYISHFTDVFEDHYSEGEGKRISSWNGSRKIKADSPLEALKEYYATELYEPFNHETIMIDGVDIWDCFTKNKHGEDPSEEETELWKKGDIKLYAYNTHIVVKAMTPVEVTF